MKRKNLLLTTACCTLLAASALAPLAHAQDAATPIQGISKAAGGTGTIAAAMAKKIPLKSPYAASHISKAEIEQASPEATADTILDTEPSINATAAGPLGVEQNITFRAFNAAQFSQTFDNIDLNDVFNSGTTNEASLKNNVLLTPQDFDSIDIYRGINNPANNSYNSVAGTINYNPLEPTDDANGLVAGSYGSFDTIGYNALYNTGKIAGFANVIAFTHQSSKGWLHGDHDTNSNFYDAFQQDTGATGKIYGNVIYNENNGEEAYDIPSGLIQKYGRNFQYPKSIYSEPDQDTNYLLLLGTTQAINDFTTVDIKGFAADDNFQRNAYSNPAYQHTGYYIPNSDPDHTSTTYYGYYTQEEGVQPSVTFDLPFNTVKIGANYTLGHLHSREYYGNGDPVYQIPGVNDLWDEHDIRTLYSIYAQDEIDLLDNKLKITPGVKYLYANTKDHDDLGYYYSVAGSVSNTAHFVSPTLGLNYEVLPGAALYGAYGRDLEFPTIDAYYNNISVGTDYDQIAPVHLQPEYVDDYEAGLRYSNTPLGFNGALGFYLENFENTFISQTNETTNITNTFNGGSSQYKGIELQLAEDFGITPVGDFTGYFNYSYNNAVYTNKTPLTIASVGNNNAVTGATVTNGDPIPLVPQDIVNIGGSWSLDGWGASVDSRYVTSQYIDQPATGVTSNLREPAYFLLDLGASKTIPVRHFGAAKSVKIAFNVDNALNRTYNAYAYDESYHAQRGTSPYNAPAGATGSYASIQEAQPQAFYVTVTLNF
jgi:outer membrane receptor protein involved in Fe transport